MLDYTIRPDLRRKGYAFHGLKLLEQFAFEDIKLMKIIGYVELDNSASQNLLKKSGYTSHLEENGLFGKDTVRPAIIFTKIRSGLKRGPLF